MSTFRYMRIPLKYITPEILGKCNIDSLASNGYIYAKIFEGMYGLKWLTLLPTNDWLQN